MIIEPICGICPRLRQMMVIPAFAGQSTSRGSCCMCYYGLVTSMALDPVEKKPYSTSSPEAKYFP